MADNPYAKYVSPDNPYSKYANLETNKEASDNIMAPVDLGLAVGSRILTAPLGPLAGLAGIGGAVLPGSPEQGKRAVEGVQKLQDKLTYEPRTPAIQTVMDAVRYPFQMFGQFAQSRADNAYNTAVANDAPMPEATGALMSGVYNAIPGALMGGITAKGIQSSRDSRSLNKVADETLRNAKANGYVLPPSATPSGNWLTDLMESVAGKAALKQDMTNKNQINTTRIATQDAGVPANTALTPEILANRRKTEAAPYREARAIDPAVNQMIDDLQNARLDAKDLAAAYQIEKRPELRRDAERAKNRELALEQQIESAAIQAGKPDLVKRLREARIQIAKIHGVEDALNPATGAVSASTFGRSFMNGDPLTGGSATIGRTYAAYPSFLGDAARNPAPGVNNLRVLAAPLMGAEGAAHAGLAGGILAGGLPLLGRPMRALLSSAPMQAIAARPPLYLGARLPGDPYLAGILATSMGAPGALARE